MSYRLKTVLLSSIIVFILIQSPLAAGAAEPRYGGTLRVALPTEPPGLDPTTRTAAVIDRVLYNNVFQGLVRINGEGEVVPSLASNWEISGGGSVYTFYLRKGVRFHNGEELTADYLSLFNREPGRIKTSHSLHINFTAASHIFPDMFVSCIHVLKRAGTVSLRACTRRAGPISISKTY